MDEFIRSLGTIGWWVSVVLVGLLINFASQWLYPRLGALPGRLGRWWRSRSETRQRSFDLKVQLLCQHPNLHPLFIAQETRMRTETLEFLVLSTLSYVVLFSLILIGKPNPYLLSVVGVAALLTLLMAKISSNKAAEHKALLEAVWDISLTDAARLRD